MTAHGPLDYVAWLCILLIVVLEFFIVTRWPVDLTYIGVLIIVVLIGGWANHQKDLRKLATEIMKEKEDGRDAE